MADRLLFIDTETGGLDPDQHSLLSLALVVWEDREIIGSHEFLINDGILSVTHEALAINRIDIGMHRQSAISPPQAVEQMFAFTGKHFPPEHKITLAGHNVHFDTRFLGTFLKKNDKEFSNYFSHRVIDTCSILYYLYLSGKIKHKAISSDAAFELFGIEAEGRHTALGDAVATARLFTKLLDLIG